MERMLERVDELAAIAMNEKTDTKQRLDAAMELARMIYAKRRPK